MKLKSILAICACFLSTLSFSQEQRYIEVTAVDTIVLKSTKLMCEINLREDLNSYMNEYMDDEMNPSTKPKKEETSIQDITKVLDQQKYKYSVVDPKLNATTFKKGKGSILIELKNEAELNKLTASLDKFEDLDVKINDVMYESPDMYYEKSYSNLYKHALNQANSLAEISGNTIGKLISASDVQHNVFDYDQLYKQMMKNIPKGIFGSSYEVKEKQQQVKMVFKFELK